MTHETIHFEITQIGQRLDTILPELFPDISRSQIQEWIKSGLVRDAANGQALKASFKAKVPFTVTVDQPVRLPFQPPQPEERSDALNIIYEDDVLLVINKPVGLTVHPGAGQSSGTLVNLLLGHTGGKLSSVNTHERPGIVHRLDKDTSGLLVVAKTNAAHVKLAEALQKRDMKRIYRALVHNVPVPKDGTVEAMIGRDPKNRQRQAIVTENGKEAITHYTTLKAYGLDMALVECRLETGRTHQIRVHMAQILHPIVGDAVYGGRITRGRNIEESLRLALNGFPRQALHARHLELEHPISGEEMAFSAEAPPDIQRLLDRLRADGSQSVGR